MVRAEASARSCSARHTLAAQQKSPIGKGSWLVGGSAGHRRTLTQSARRRAYRSRRSAFTSSRRAWPLGGTLDLRVRVIASAQTTIRTPRSSGIEPTIRYFFGDLPGKLFPYLNASIGPSWEKFKIDGATVGGEQTTHGLDITGSAGLMQMLSTHVGLTGELFYTHAHQSTDVVDYHVDHHAQSEHLRATVRDQRVRLLSPTLKTKTGSGHPEPVLCFVEAALTSRRGSS